MARTETVEFTNMQHNKNSDANVGIRCEAQATKRKGKRNWKSPRVGYREGKKI